MKILIIGGTRFIGKAICEKFISQEHEVILFNRGQTQHSLGVQTIFGDVEGILNFKDQLLENDFDVVVHCISHTEKHASDLVSIFSNTKTHLIVLSSVDGYEAFQGLNRKEDKAELPITEDSLLSSMMYYWSDSSTKGLLSEKYDKNLMTEILMVASRTKELTVTVFRLSMVYGPGDYQYPRRHGAFIRRIIDKRKSIIFSDREQCQVYTFGYVENIAAAIAHSLKKSITFGKIYNLGETKARSQRRWAELYAKVANWEFDIHILPEELIRMDKSFRNAPPKHLLIDSSLFCRETKFAYPINLDEAVKRTINYAIEHPNILGEPENYDGEDHLLRVFYSKMDQIHSKMSEDS